MAPGASAADSSGGDADASPCLCFIISATSMKDAKAQTHDGNGNLVSRTLRHDCHAKPAEGIWNEWTKVFIGEVGICVFTLHQADLDSLCGLKGGFGTVHCLRGVYSSKKLVFKTSVRWVSLESGTSFLTWSTRNGRTTRSSCSLACVLRQMFSRSTLRFPNTLFPNTLFTT